MRSRLSLTLDEANAMMRACIDAARRYSRAVSIAIVDDSCGLLSFKRMDGARIHTIDLAQRKVRASALIGVPTGLIETMMRDRPQAPDLAAGQGGLPVLHGGDCVGAIGVSGAKPGEDEAIAQAGMDILKGP